MKEYFEFSLTESRKARAQLALPYSRIAFPHIAGERTPHCLQQQVLGRPLLEEVLRTGAHGGHRRSNLAVASKEEDRQRVAGTQKCRLQIQPIQSGHLQVGYHAAGNLVIVLLQKFTGR